MNDIRLTMTNSIIVEVVLKETNAEDFGLSHQLERTFSSPVSIPNQMTMNDSGFESEETCLMSPDNSRSLSAAGTNTDENMSTSFKDVDWIKEVFRLRRSACSMSLIYPPALQSNLMNLKPDLRATLSNETLYRVKYSISSQDPHSERTHELVNGKNIQSFIDKDTSEECPDNACDKYDLVIEKDSRSQVTHESFSIQVLDKQEVTIHMTFDGEPVPYMPKSLRRLHEDNKMVGYSYPKDGSKIHLDFCSIKLVDGCNCAVQMNSTIYCENTTILTNQMVRIKPSAKRHGAWCIAKGKIRKLLSY